VLHAALLIGAVRGEHNSLLDPPIAFAPPPYFPIEIYTLLYPLKEEKTVCKHGTRKGKST